MKKKRGGHIWVVGRRGVEGCSTQQGKRKNRLVESSREEGECSSRMRRENRAALDPDMSNSWL